MNLIKHFRNNWYQSFLNSSQKTEDEEALPDSFDEASNILIPKQRTRKENYRSIFVMNISAKLFNKILANQIQRGIKRIIHHDQGKFLPEMKGLFPWSCYLTSSFLHFQLAGHHMQGACKKKVKKHWVPGIVLHRNCFITCLNNPTKRYYSPFRIGKIYWEDFVLSKISCSWQMLGLVLGFYTPRSLLVPLASKPQANNFYNNIILDIKTMQESLYQDWKMLIVS